MTNQEVRGLCEYCHEDSDGYVKPLEKNCHVFIRFGMGGWEIPSKPMDGAANAKFVTVRCVEGICL